MEQKISETSEILLYQNGDDKEYIRVIFQDENFWLTQAGMAELFDSSKSNISEHLTHIFDEDGVGISGFHRRFRIHPRLPGREHGHLHRLLSVT